MLLAWRDRLYYSLLRWLQNVLLIHLNIFHLELYLRCVLCMLHVLKILWDTLLAIAPKYEYIKISIKALHNLGKRVYAAHNLGIGWNVIDKDIFFMKMSSCAEHVEQRFRVIFVCGKYIGKFNWIRFLFKFYWNGFIIFR